MINGHEAFYINSSEQNSLGPSYINALTFLNPTSNITGHFIITIYIHPVLLHKFPLFILFLSSVSNLSLSVSVCLSVCLSVSASKKQQEKREKKERKTQQNTKQTTTEHRFDYFAGISLHRFSCRLFLNSLNCSMNGMSCSVFPQLFASF